MKKIYTTGIVLSILTLFSCSKDFLKSYEHRIIGTWTITDIDRRGIGGNMDNLPFKQGTFSFNEDGSLIYTNLSGAVYNGSWDIRKKQTGDERIQSLQITAVDFGNQNVLTEFYDDINFTGTNHFNGKIISGSHTFVTHFRR
jgi:hypothetical protein